VVADCGGSKPSSPAAPGKGSRIVTIVLENKDFDQVIGSSEAPFINSLAKQGSLATNFFAIQHPSPPNYIAMTAGTTGGIGDCEDCSLPLTSIVDQMEEAGISWKAYMEGAPGPCYTGPEHGLYTRRHNPFMIFSRVARDPKRCEKVQTLPRLLGDLRAKRLPTYVWFTPDECHDAHDCSLAVADRFLSGLVPRLQRQLGPDGFLILTWDEGDKESSQADGDADRGGRIATIVAGPGVKKGSTYPTPADHYSLLRTVEDALGLSPLRNAKSAQPLDGMFKAPPRLR
jgi:hypothetical protein